MTHEPWFAARQEGRVVRRRVTDLQTLRELADAVDKDRGHSGSLLTRTMRQAANEIEELRARLRLACEPCAECGHIDYRELDDMLPSRAANSQADPE